MKIFLIIMIHCRDFVWYIGNELIDKSILYYYLNESIDILLNLGNNFCQCQNCKIILCVSHVCAHNFSTSNNAAQSTKGVHYWAPDLSTSPAEIRTSARIQQKGGHRVLSWLLFAKTEWLAARRAAGSDRLEQFTWAEIMSVGAGEGFSG